MTADDISTFTSEALAAAAHAGLGRAVTEFPEDVVAAAEAAAHARRACAEAGTPAPTDEPWPPMRTRIAS